MLFPRPTALRCIPFACAAAVLLAACGGDDVSASDSARPISAKVQVVGHRGASALRPEHTLASYRKAIEDGADVIEPDLVATRDGVLVARHENEISGTTNVSTLPQFASRKATRTIDGTQLTGWFTEDFTLAELKTLRARERIPQVRPANTAYNDQFEIPTFDEIVALAKQMSAQTGRTIHLYPETKHPTYFQSIGLPLEDRLVDALQKDPYTARTATVYIQSFEVANLKAIRNRIKSSQPNWKLVQLMDEAGQRPYDFVKANDKRTYGDLSTRDGMREIASYANGVGPYKTSIIAVAADGTLQQPTSYVRDAHAAGLVVHPYTFRPENNFLPASLKDGGTPATRNTAGSVREIQAYLRAGIDGFFTDDPAVGRTAVDTFKR
ncbi:MULTISPECIES: glycerophosphodiester phosphodiesterase [unclassified Burkholderia]|uniref:glycerophosphodiester phosphodiesterase n=1 Tax=unclassified Burkholderia TaxID=2613784 RepID=UPI0005CE438C|nr:MULTISPECIES: glycerophosphodiester phosphodiesterase [unclassified Burkholderia]RQR46914.1 glycerophosphodiester phosphodiesterase [Burkholderia sp. Bp9131]RQR79800.1 glycerophosphodiester phosphodiesterase [Burkholderia sp. Bp9015]RQS34972.1 glycerophosphodiester phosphodiesterase [Burkholderia sp. Bp8995]RQS45295.1 glycerophosphodiester phosphodiesterase [Burkholderia sp. Bp8990]RQS52303.1 glycerophosphodiester phosphodiesterase [Burkholderia sp. Bp8989]